MGRLLGTHTRPPEPSSAPVGRLRCHGGHTCEQTGHWKIRPPLTQSSFVKFRAGKQLLVATPASGLRCRCTIPLGVGSGVCRHWIVECRPDTTSSSHAWSDPGTLDSGPCSTGPGSRAPWHPVQSAFPEPQPFVDVGHSIWQVARTMLGAQSPRKGLRGSTHQGCAEF